MLLLFSDGKLAKLVKSALDIYSSFTTRHDVPSANHRRGKTSASTTSSCGMPLPAIGRGWILTHRICLSTSHAARPSTLLPVRDVTGEGATPAASISELMQDTYDESISQSIRWWFFQTCGEMRSVLLSHVGFRVVARCNRA